MKGIMDMVKNDGLVNNIKFTSGLRHKRLKLVIKVNWPLLLRRYEGSRCLLGRYYP